MHWNAMLFTSITNFVEKNDLIADNTTIIIGLSGGPDSVFLLYYLHEIAQKRKLNLIGAHLDHEWRQDSKEDTLFCKQLCEKLGIKFISAKASELDIEFKKTGSLEDLGRKMRRHFLLKLCTDYKAHAIALAHHADDQQETFFIRLLRGTALAGLCSMRPQSGKFIRPLLTIFKKEILSYLNSHQISYLTDPTNEQDDFLRNRIRKMVIPALRESDQRFDKNFMSTLSHLQDAEDTLTALTKVIYEDLSEMVDGAMQLNIDKLLAFSPYLRNRILMYWLITENAPFTPTEKFLAEIVRFIKQPESKDHNLHENWKLRKKKNKIWIIFN